MRRRHLADLMISNRHRGRDIDALTSPARDCLVERPIDRGDDDRHDECPDQHDQAKGPEVTELVAARQQRALQRQYDSHQYACLGCAATTLNSLREYVEAGGFMSSGTI